MISRVYTGLNCPLTLAVHTLAKETVRPIWFQFFLHKMFTASAHEEYTTALLFSVLINIGSNHYIPLQSANHQLALW